MRELKPFWRPRRIKRLALVLLAVACSLSLGFLAGLSQNKPPSFSTAEAEKIQKVLQAIETVQQAQQESGRRSLKSLILTESELNAYIAYRVVTDPIDLLQGLELKLLDDNRLEGKAVFDLRQENLPSFIPKVAPVFFAASFRVEAGRIFFSFHKIYLGTQELAVDFVSEMIKAIAIAHNAPAEGLNRSYELPFGLKDIKSKKGLAIFYY